MTRLASIKFSPLLVLLNPELDMTMRIVLLPRAKSRKRRDEKFGRRAGTPMKENMRTASCSAQDWNDFTEVPEGVRVGTAVRTGDVTITLVRSSGIRLSRHFAWWGLPRRQSSAVDAVISRNQTFSPRAESPRVDSGNVVATTSATP